jgi:hypothetical protein
VAAVQCRLGHTRFLLELEDRAPHDLGDLGSRHQRAERIAKPSDGARVQLRHARLVHTDFSADLLHRGFAVVIEADDLLLARRKRGDGRTHAILRLLSLVRSVRLFRL